MTSRRQILGVTRLMIFDLIPQEIMNRRERFGIRGRYADSPAALDGFELVGDLGFQSRHRGDAGRDFSVSEHRRAEVALFEHLCDVRQMRLDLIEARRVAGFIGGHFDRAPIIG